MAAQSAPANNISSVKIFPEDQRGVPEAEEKSDSCLMEGEA